MSRTGDDCRNPGGFSVNKAVILSYEIMPPRKTAYFKVFVKPNSGRPYLVLKRFRQFEDLDKQVKQHLSIAELPALPPKRPKFLGQSPEFLEERRILLEYYLTRCLNSQAVKNSSLLADFLSTDKFAGDAREGESESQQALGDSNYEFPDWQEIRRITIPQAKIMSDHVLYQIHCSSTRDPHSQSLQSHWVSLKRFTDFYIMLKNLRQELSVNFPFVLKQLPIATPARKSRVLHDHTDPIFVEHRRILLEYYLNKLLRVEQAASSDVFLRFCAVPGI